jgi:hypothetical protein
MSLRRRAQSECVPSEVPRNGPRGEACFQPQSLMRATHALHNAAAAARRNPCDEFRSDIFFRAGVSDLGPIGVAGAS